MKRLRPNIVVVIHWVTQEPPFYICFTITTVLNPFQFEITQTTINKLSPE